MNNKKFKVGDRVRIIDASLIEPYELNKIGVIVDIDDNNSNWIICKVDMGRPRRVSEPDVTCWYLRDTKIELTYKPNQQLLFEFMK